MDTAIDMLVNCSSKQIVLCIALEAMHEDPYHMEMIRIPIESTLILYKKILKSQFELWVRITTIYHENVWVLDRSYFSINITLTRCLGSDSELGY